MTASYNQLKNLTQGTPNNPTNATGEISESIIERILTCLAIVASGTFPDGSAWPGGGGGGGVTSFNTRTGVVTLLAADLTALMTMLSSGTAFLVAGGSTLAPTITLSATAITDLGLAASSVQSVTAGASGAVVVSGTATAPIIDLSNQQLDSSVLYLHQFFR